eukprot:2775531-Rhodomonas_salina.1
MPAPETAEHAPCVSAGHHDRRAQGRTSGVTWKVHWNWKMHTAVHELQMVVEDKRKEKECGGKRGEIWGHADRG